MFQNCTALRNELDDQHKIRMESFEIKMKPIIIRDGPSRKVVKKTVPNLESNSTVLMSCEYCRPTSKSKPPSWHMKYTR